MPPWVYPLSVIAAIVVAVQCYILYNAWGRKWKEDREVKELERICR